MKTGILLNEITGLWRRKPSAVLLSLSSEALGVYPLFLRLSLFLYRLVQ